jgi:hypothetical protein
VSLGEQCLTCHRAVMCSGLGSSSLLGPFAPVDVRNYSSTVTVSDLTRECDRQGLCPLEKCSEVITLCNAKCHRGKLLLGDLLTPCSGVLLEQLIVSQLVKKLPAFCGTKRFITTFTSACHLSLS